MADKVEQIKLILLGDEKSGKSSFYNKYVNNNFIEEYNPSLKTQFKKININIIGIIGFFGFKLIVGDMSNEADEVPKIFDIVI